MKQANKKASSDKVPATEKKATKGDVTPKVDPALLQKANQFHRFLEASCDCV